MNSILPVGTPSLRERSTPLADQSAASVVADARALTDALAAFRAEHGFGRAIAAPQIGVNRRLIALALPGWPSVIINPEIVWHSAQTMTVWDDCMCFPDMLVRVLRHVSVSVAFTTLDGERQVRETLGQAEAELIQHEIDHLDGVLSFDRATGVNAIVSRKAFDADPAAFIATVDFHPGQAVTEGQP
ncbi:Peptide deformylase [Paraburkholderia unamae]|uniref:peptide deformylase n=1 Tax=Paraburkholderia unamae TaxID=219649 RepID=UPI001CB46E0A|nr:peptide deformylase [Paraburkholderia unamae]CAG9258674.1 Peptide deformylase [Paraburkholderia unamae]